MSNPYLCVFRKMLENTLEQNERELDRAETVQNFERNQMLNGRMLSEFQKAVLSEFFRDAPWQRPLQ